jgi:hypothetical protein
MPEGTTLTYFRISRSSSCSAIESMDGGAFFFARASPGIIAISTLVARQVVTTAPSRSLNGRAEVAFLMMSRLNISPPYRWARYRSGPA